MERFLSGLSSTHVLVVEKMKELTPLFRSELAVGGHYGAQPLTSARFMISS